MGGEQLEPSVLPYTFPDREAFLDFPQTQTYPLDLGWISIGKHRIGIRFALPTLTLFSRWGQYRSKRTRGSVRLAVLFSRCGIDTGKARAIGPGGSHRSLIVSPAIAISAHGGAAGFKQPDVTF